MITGGYPEPGHGRGALLPAEAEEQPASFADLCSFLEEYVCEFISFGGQSTRVERGVTRLGMVFGLKVDLMLFYRHAVITVASLCEPSLHKTTVLPFKPIGHNFSMTYSLNKLSWDAFDDWLEAVGAPPPGNGGPGPGMTFVMGFCVPDDQLRTGSSMRAQKDLNRLMREFYEIIQRPRLPDKILCPVTGVASACFCRLFMGDWLAMLIVFISCQAAFLARRAMLEHRVDIRLAFLAAAFITSLLATVGVWNLPSATPSTAVASSVLFLVPGVPLLSAVNDIIHGRTLMGISRGTNAAVLTLCIAFGLVASLMVTGFNVL